LLSKHTAVLVRADSLVGERVLRFVELLTCMDTTNGSTSPSQDVSFSIISGVIYVKKFILIKPRCISR